ncbi:MAG: hypothetical protein FWF94_06180 [Oscillospiraceae bacterium]|nr:hypothetical protein [Oscillospiraceae bacterium]
MKHNKKNIDNYNTFELKLNPPHEFEGQTYTALTFDFRKLKGKDFIDVEREMNDNGEYSVRSANVEPRFLYRIAAKAGNIGSDVIENLPLGSFNKIVNAARNFLNYTEYKEMSDDG